MNPKRETCLLVAAAGLNILTLVGIGLQERTIRKLDYTIQRFSQEARNAAVSPSNSVYNTESNKTYTLPAEEEQQVIKETYK